jgi:hypothetical protein
MVQTVRRCTPIEARARAAGLATMAVTRPFASRSLNARSQLGQALLDRGERLSGAALLSGPSACAPRRPSGLFAKRLEQDRFHWPKLIKGSVRMSATQLAALVEGMDWMRVRSAPLVQPTSTG